MKLRLRSFEIKETLKVEVPNPCSLQHLKELVAQQLPPPSLPSAIYLSLNRKDELTTSSPEESIQSVGITSGDLIYFATNPNGFSTGPQVVSPTVPSIPKSEPPQFPQILNNGKKDETPNNGLKETLEFNPGKVETVGSRNLDSEDTEESMEIDDDDNTEAGKSFSVPGFLRKVFTEELGADDGFNHKLLGIAVRAVLLESGFVEIDPASNSLKSNNFDVKGSWYLASYYFTLPDIINGGNVETVKIKYQNLGKYCKVYGSLVNGTEVHSVLLDEDRLVPFLNVVWANCGQVVETMGENNRVSSVLPEREVFEFWRKTKDGLALPLLIDLCEKAGFELPACFMRLPTELKLKILESISGVDLAKVSCVCSELRYLASSDELWKEKYMEELRNEKFGGSGRTFKEIFGKAWDRRKRRRAGGRSAALRRRNPAGPFGASGYFPRMIGGEYDMFPYRGLFNLRGGRFNGRPNCNLGSLNS